jgi:hypothetical protein
VLHSRQGEPYQRAVVGRVRQRRQCFDHGRCRAGPPTRNVCHRGMGRSEAGAEASPDLKASGLKRPTATCCFRWQTKNGRMNVPVARKPDRCRPREWRLRREKTKRHREQQADLSHRRSRWPAASSTERTAGECQAGGDANRGTLTPLWPREADCVDRNPQNGKAEKHRTDLPDPDGHKVHSPTKHSGTVRTRREKRAASQPKVGVSRGEIARPCRDLTCTITPLPARADYPSIPRKETDFSFLFSAAG